MESPGVSEILEKYEDSLLALQQTVVFKSVTEYFFEGAFPPDTFPARRVLIGNHRRDHDRLDLILVRMSFDSIADDEPSDYDKRREMAIHYHMGWEVDAAGESPTLITCETRKDDSYRSILYLSEYGATLDGIIPNDEFKNIPEIIREASSMKLRQEMETIDGHATFVLDAQTKYGRYVLWIDPEYGYNPRRITASKDIEEGLDPFEEGTRPGSLMTGEEITVDSIRIEKVDNVFVPTSANIARYRTFADGQWTRIRVVEKRSDFDFNPDFDSLGAFAMDIPKGVKIRNKDVPSLELVWQDGQIRPAGDDLVATDKVVSPDQILVDDESVADSGEESGTRQSMKSVQTRPTVATDPNVRTTAIDDGVDRGTSGRKSISSIWLIVLMIVGLLAVAGVHVSLHRRRFGNHSSDSM